MTRIFQGAHERPNPKKKTQNSRLIGKLVSGPSGVEQKGSFLGKLFSWGKKSEDMAVPQPVKAVETETTTSGQEAGSTTHQFKAAGETVGVPNVQERFTLRIVEAVEDGLPEK